MLLLVNWFDNRRTVSPSLIKQITVNFRLIYLIILIFNVTLADINTSDNEIVEGKF